MSTLHLTKLQRWIVLAIVSSALFLIVVDMTVLYTVLPQLTHDLAASASEKLWIVNIYPLVMAGLLPGLGTLGDRLGHKRLFVIGLAVFGIASLIAAYAPVPYVLIAARTLLAIGAAMMMPATLSIIRTTFTDERERSLAVGIWASVSSVGAGMGPLVGGFLLEHFWWGSVFLINIPIAVLALIMAVFLIPNRKGNANKKWDLIGSIQIMIGLVGLVYAIKEISRREGSSTIALISAVIGIVAMIFFIRHQRKSSDPLIDFSLFRDSRFTTGVVTALLSSFALVGMELVVTQRLQLVLGYSPLEAGMYVVFTSIASFISGIFIGLVLHRVDKMKVQWICLFVSGLGMGAFLLFHNGNIILQIVSLMILGAGLGGAMTTASNSIMLNVPIEKAGMAASIEEVSFELGSALSITLLGSLSTFVYTASIVLPEGLSVPPVVQDSLDEALLAAENLPTAASSTLIELAQSAFDKSFVVVLATATIILLVAAFMIRSATLRTKVRDNTHS
ncbi:DHA2 family multidrug resistance protein-like MFS transporter [Paenibacillus anaericanus]|uniref:MFS transporter n=1 Tax=Paenibacillus anaericanus TaxID=170367 RepID=UPI002782C5FF|nr:MFS transporter [Paenibacillus anaericanus]MDQ0091203.1 DHA2 family multidrug resistance protein-like MFS transporter [Paenibacillus anaericanus]